MYPCEAEHDSELSFQVGAIFNAGKCYRLHQSLRTGPGILDSAGEKKTNAPIWSSIEGRDERRSERVSRKGSRRHFSEPWKRLG